MAATIGICLRLLGAVEHYHDAARSQVARADHENRFDVLDRPLKNFFCIDPLVSPVRGHGFQPAEILADDVDPEVSA